jgi:3-deoxy-manno-octulosonate cytidylyltransferase (CMP-KDO synthetase)
VTVLAVIPARLSSTRLAQKPLRLLGGQPLIVRVWERVQRLAFAQQVVVATDSVEIATVVRAAGGEAVMTRADHASGTDRVAEAAAGRAASVIVNVQGDEPFVSTEAIHGAVAMVRDAGFAIGTAGVSCTRDDANDPACVKVVRADDGRALYFSRAVIPCVRESKDEATQSALLTRHIGVYAYRPDALARWVAWPVHPLESCERLEQLRPLAHGVPIGVALVADAGGTGIDTEADLAAANVRWSATSSPHPEGVA